MLIIHCGQKFKVKHYVKKWGTNYRVPDEFRPLKAGDHLVWGVEEHLKTVESKIRYFKKSKGFKDELERYKLRRTARNLLIVRDYLYWIGFGGEPKLSNFCNKRQCHYRRVWLSLVNVPGHNEDIYHDYCNKAFNTMGYSSRGLSKYPK